MVSAMTFRNTRLIGIYFLLGLAICAVLLLQLDTSPVPKIAQAQSNNAATGLPRIVVSAEGPGILGVDTWDIRDADGLPYGPPNAGTTEVGGPADGKFTFAFNYQWIRVDGGTEVNVGTNSPRYQLTDADFGKTFKVRVSFTDRSNNAEAVTSVAFGPIARPVSLPSPTTLVANTGETAGLVTTAFTSDPMDPMDYAIGFKLGNHGQGYEISSVSIDLAAVPSSLSVSLWTSGPPGSSAKNTRRAKLFEFENPDSFVVGLNEFTAPVGVHALQARKYWIVLSGFGTSVSIKEVTSDDQDSTGAPGAEIDDDAGGDTKVLRLAITGRVRTTGIIAANLTQPNTEGNQEIISVGDNVAWSIKLGSADRFLVRGMGLTGDDTTSVDGGWDDPWYFRSSYGGNTIFRMFQTRNVNGLPTWTAPQGATVQGDGTYVVRWAGGHESFRNDGVKIERIGGILHRSMHVDAAADGKSDDPTAAGSSLGKGEAISSSDAAGPTPYMVVYGVPLYAVMGNLGQTDNGYVSVGGTNDVVSQGFTTGPQSGGYALQGIGVNIEGSQMSGTAQIPADASAVSVSLHADSSGQPGAKLFDLLSPTEFAAGLSFFEAPRGARLEPSTSYVLVWRHNSGANHRLVKTTGNGEDPGLSPGTSIANAYRLGADVTSLTEDSGGNALEITVYSGEVASRPATGRPRVLAAAQGAGILAADTELIADPNGLPIDDSNTWVTFNWSYQWIRVDGNSETNVGANSATYQPVEADVGKKIKVRVSFIDGAGNSETVTSLPFGPIAELAGTTQVPSNLLSNTGQSPVSTASITQQYAIGIRLGHHGRGYEISSVSINLGAVPSSLKVSLWAAGVEGGFQSSNASKLFEFANPASFVTGLNKFTAPAGAFAYPNVNYFIVLSDFGSSLSIRETTSDVEDDVGNDAGIIYDKAAVRGLNATDRQWSISPSRNGVPLLIVEGSKRGHGILATNFSINPTDDKGTVDTSDDTGPSQEIISVGDNGGFGIKLGSADRYLIRGVVFNSDDTTPAGGGFTNPFVLRMGTRTGAEQFTLVNTRPAPGLSEWTAPRGSTVTGAAAGQDYVFDWPIGPDDGPDRTRRRNATLSRFAGAFDSGVNSPAAADVSFTAAKGDFDISNPYTALHGEPLYALVQNLGQTDDGYRSVGGSNKVLSQGFTTGSRAQLLTGIGINIEGSRGNFPDGPTSVSVAVHADSGGKPGAKLFDLVSPDEFAAGHSFFEAPPNTILAPNTSYVVVWSHLGGTQHRLRKTGSGSEDSGAATGFSIANTFYQGADLANMASDPGSDVLEIAVYRSRNLPNATGRPTVIRSAENAGILFADPAGIADSDGLPYLNLGGIIQIRRLSYQWIRVDAATEAETLVGVDSPRYHSVDADVGDLLKVRVSYVDEKGAFESLTSLPFGPIPERPAPLPGSTLVGNTGQSASTAVISEQYALGFRLGDHGQGYEISSVSIDLAAVPSSLTVSLWIGGRAGMLNSGLAAHKLFDFENPASFGVGLNEFKAPAGALAYQKVNYFIVLSDFGDSLEIKETALDAEDAGGETGAAIFDSAATRGLGSTGGWYSSTSRGNVLRMAVKGSQRDRGILVANYAQATIDNMGSFAQEIVSLGDLTTVEIDVGAADRYLIRGVSFQADGTIAILATPPELGVSSTGGPIGNPYYVWNTSSRTDTDLTAATSLFSLTNTRSQLGISLWSALQGSTVAGGNASYFVGQRPTDPRLFSVLGRYFATIALGQDEPPAAGAAFASDATVGDGAWGDGRPLMAVIGEPLHAMVQNLGQTNHDKASFGPGGVVSQGFTTGSDAFGYRLQGVGFNIEGSDGRIPAGPSDVSVSVHADSNGKPGGKLFDLISPAEFAVGHSFFEAPPGARLEPNTSYVVVWSHVGDNPFHRLQLTDSNSEDSGARSGAGIANAFYSGTGIANLSKDSNNDVLEISVYTEVLTSVPFLEGGINVPLNWFHIPDGAFPGYQFRALVVSNRAIDATSADKTDYDDHINFDLQGRLQRREEAGLPDDRFGDKVIRDIANEGGFRALVCTANDQDARVNAGMDEDGVVGVPIHWLNGGWQNRPTLVAQSYTQFFGPTWLEVTWGAHVTGNSASLYEISSHKANEGDKIITGIFTGCDSTGMAHDTYHMGSAAGMATLGTPGDDAQNAPLGPTPTQIQERLGADLAILLDEARPIYAISPLFTVVDEDGANRTVWSSSMRVGTSTDTFGTVVDEYVGARTNFGSFEGSTQFSLGGTSYSVSGLFAQKQTVSGTVNVDAVQLQMPLLPPEAADSKLVLELTCWGSCRGNQGTQRSRFLLSDATRQTNLYVWDNPGLTWSKGNEVVIRLIELRS